MSSEKRSRIMLQRAAKASPSSNIYVENSNMSSLNNRIDFDSETPSKRPRKSILKNNREIKTPVSRKTTQLCKTAVTDCIDRKVSDDDSDTLEYNSNSPSTSQPVETSSSGSRYVLHSVSDEWPIRELTVGESENICLITPENRALAKSSELSVRKYFHYSNPFNAPSEIIHKSRTKSNSVKKIPVSKKKTQVSQKNVTGRKVKKVPFIDPYTIECDLNAYIESAASESIKCSQEIDLFGEPVPLSTCVSKLEPEKKCVKKTPRKTPVTRKKKLIPENVTMHTNDNLDVSGIQVLPDSPAVNTKDKSTTNIGSKPEIGISNVKIPSESLTTVGNKEFINKLTNVKCNPKLDVSGEQSPSTSCLKEKSAPKFKFDPDDEFSGIDYLISRPLSPIESDCNVNPTLFEGVVAYVDYRQSRMKNIGDSVIWKLHCLGGKVEKKFTEKVTHVIFNKGYQRTYDTAIKRNIPLVSARWLEYSGLINKQLDPAKYAPYDLEKYKNPLPTPKRKYYNSQKLNKQIYNFATRQDFLRAKLFEIESMKDTDPYKEEVERSKNKINALSKSLHESLSFDNSHKVKSAGNRDRSVPIKIIRKWLTPIGRNYKETTALNDDIINYENYFQLNSIERIRFRKSLYPSDRYLNNIKNMKLDCDTVDIQSIACTGLTKSEIDVMKNYIQNLGTFTFHTEVEQTTTYVVTKSKPNRTLHMVFAMAYGCYIISEEWVLKSYEIGKWLPHQQYLISDLSEPVKEFQTRRQESGIKSLTLRIFNNIGFIYISDSCEIDATKLRSLVETCGGHCSILEYLSDVIVGNTPEGNNNSISEKWILDCISQGKLLDTNQYRLVNNKMT